MNSLKRLVLAISLGIVLAVAAFGGETNSPPSCNPGETNSPPCTSSPIVIDETYNTSTNTTTSSDVGVVVLESTIFAIETLINAF